MSPRRHLSLSTIVVPDYDTAIEYYVNVLGFFLREDTTLAPDKRWVVVCPDQESSHGILLAAAKNPQERRRIGDQTGGRVAFFLQTEDFETSYREMKRRGVRFCEPPRRESYGMVAVFTYLFGNRWDLIEPRDGSGTESKEGPSSADTRR